MNDHKTKATEEVLTGYSKIIEALTEQGRWQAERIRELEKQVEQTQKWQVELIAKWLWADVLYRQYKGDYLEAREEVSRRQAALTAIEFDAGGYCNGCMGLRRHEDDCPVGQVLKGGSG